METRWRFRDQPVMANESGRVRVGSAPRWSWAARKGDGNSVRKRAGPDAKKSDSGVTGCPYPKPTQVGEARSLRRASDLSLRNSANSPRNFGRRGPGGVRRRGHYSGPSDCLPKTQVPAKSQDAV